MKEIIIKEFRKEFQLIEERFEIIPLTISEARATEDIKVAAPGVYVFWSAKRIIKVGRHLVNSRKRSLEHIKDNTRNKEFEMASLDNCINNCGLILINCIDKNDYHWVAAIEIYLERVLGPVIKSKRTG